METVAVPFVLLLAFLLFLMAVVWVAIPYALWVKGKNVVPETNKARLIYFGRFIFWVVLPAVFIWLGFLEALDLLDGLR